MSWHDGSYKRSDYGVSTRFREPARRPSAIAGAGLLMCLVSLAARADLWAVTPSVSVRGQYDDNINMSVDAPVSDWGGTVSPMLDARRSTANSSVGLGARLIFNRYADVGRRDTNIQLFTFSGRTRTRLSRFDLTGSYMRDTTIMTTVTQVGSGDPGQDGTDDAGNVDDNIVQTIVRRSQLRVKPSWTYSMTRTMSLKLGYSLNMTTYGDEAGTSLVDYGRQGINADFISRLSHKDQLTLGAVASHYQAPDRGSETDDYSVYTRWGHEYSELVSGELALGLLSATTTYDNDEVQSSALLYEASLRKRAKDLTTYRVTLGRRPYPSGRGTLVLSDSVRGNMTHAVSPKLSFSIWADANRNQSLDFFGSSTDRTYYSVEPGFRWMLTRLWSLDGSYRYRWQKFDAQDDVATGNAVYLSVSYAWPNMAVSR